MYFDSAITFDADAPRNKSVRQDYPLPWPLHLMTLNRSRERRPLPPSLSNLSAGASQVGLKWKELTISLVKSLAFSFEIGLNLKNGWGEHDRQDCSFAVLRRGANDNGSGQLRERCDHITFSHRKAAVRFGYEREGRGHHDRPYTSFSNVKGIPGSS